MPAQKNLEEVLASVSDMFPLLDEHRVEVDSRGMGNDTPLHSLAWRNDVAGAEVVVAAGADVNAVGEMSETPLHVAISMQCVEMARLLLHAGADPEIRSEFDETPREKAIKLGGPIAEMFEKLPTVESRISTNQ